jgi:hypothetical protein
MIRVQKVDIGAHRAAVLLNARPARQLDDLNEVAAGVVQLGDGRAGHFGRRHGELGTARCDALVIALDVVGVEHGRGPALLEHGRSPALERRRWQATSRRKSCDAGRQLLV